MNVKGTTNKAKSARLRLGLTQQALGYRSRTSAADVSRIENGRALPYPGQAKRIARVLNLRPEELQQPED